MMTRLILGNVYHMHRCSTVLHMAATGSFSFQERSVSLPISQKIWKRKCPSSSGKSAYKRQAWPCWRGGMGWGGPDSGSEGRACDLPGGFLSQHLVALELPPPPPVQREKQVPEPLLWLPGGRSSALGWAVAESCAESWRGIKTGWLGGGTEKVKHPGLDACLHGPAPKSPRASTRNSPSSQQYRAWAPIYLFALGPYPDMLRAHTWLCSQGSLLVGPYGMGRLYANSDDAKQMTSRLCSGPRQLHKFVGLVWFWVHTRHSGVTCGSMIRNHSW